MVNITKLGNHGNSTDLDLSLHCPNATLRKDFIEIVVHSKFFLWKLNSLNPNLVTYLKLRFFQEVIFTFFWSQIWKYLISLEYLWRLSGSLKLQRKEFKLSVSHTFWKLKETKLKANYFPVLFFNFLNVFPVTWTCWLSSVWF